MTGGTRGVTQHMKLPNGFRDDPAFQALSWRAAMSGTITFEQFESMKSLPEEEAREFYGPLIECRSRTAGVTRDATAEYFTISKSPATTRY